MKLREIVLKDGFFLALVAVLFCAAVVIFAPFFSVIILAVILVEFFHPLYDKLKTKIGPWPASFVTTMIVILLVVIPLVLIAISATGEAINFGAKIKDFLLAHGFVDQTGTIDLSRFKDILQTLNIDSSSIDLKQLVIQLGGTTGTAIYNLLSSVINDVINLLIKGFLMIFTMLYLFVDYHRIGAALKRISPLPDDLDEVFAQKFRSTARAVIKGTFIIAILQGLAVAVVMQFMGLEPIILWWVIMVLLSIVPVGSGLVWFPIGMVLIFSGRYAEGIFLIVYSAIIINVIDTTFRPRLIKEGTNLHPILALFSALGGLAVFGLIGLIYGPLITVFFVTAMEIYHKRYQGNADD